MPDFVRVTSTGELPEADAAREFTVGDKTICIANVNGRYCALDNVCPHQGGPLGQGYIDGQKLVCPWHGWQIDPVTGSGDGGDDVPVYEMRIEGYDVLVRL